MNKRILFCIFVFLNLFSSDYDGETQYYNTEVDSYTSGYDDTFKLKIMVLKLTMFHFLNIITFANPFSSSEIYKKIYRVKEENIYSQQEDNEKQYPERGFLPKKEGNKIFNWEKVALKLPMLHFLNSSKDACSFRVCEDYKKICALKEEEVKNNKNKIFLSPASHSDTKKFTIHQPLKYNYNNYKNSNKKYLRREKNDQKKINQVTKNFCKIKQFKKFFSACKKKNL